MAALKVLCVHGVGDHHSDTTWQVDWSEVITNAVKAFDDTRPVAIDFSMYDYIFEKPQYRITPSVVASAVWKLSVSGIVHGIGDLFRRSRGIADIPSRVRWTAGMVVQWADKPNLRAETRADLTQKIDAFQPDLICAHSLGSLVVYDTLVRGAGRQLAQGRRLMTFGSQIGNPFVRNAFGGRIVPLNLDFWYHLFNPHDDVFAHEISLPRDRFVQIKTEFDLPGVGDHDARYYMRHDRAADRAWRDIAQGTNLPSPIARTFEARRAQAAAPAGKAGAKKRAQKQRRRALLVGINEYPNPTDRLEGCVNDVFTMSALLQETGFQPEDIRVVLDDRATADGVRDRLEWLLDDVLDENDERVFYYSGHGAQIPAYGEGDQADHLDECLVPYDFDWSETTAITDDHFFELYSQLPYDARFVAIFDCCHSGGMTRAGGARIRGMTPPDDIRHRAMTWNARLQMWEARELPSANVDLEGNKDRKAAYVGESGAKHRLGRAIPLRRLRDAAYDKERRAAGHLGPYMPIIFQACEEGELAYEYRHGVTAYGAFTYSLARVLRDARFGGRPISFVDLKNVLVDQLVELKYDQTPCLVGPSDLVRRPIPWRFTSASGQSTGKRRRPRRGAGNTRPRRSTIE